MPLTPGTVSAAIVLAATAHDGQLDKAGKPYIFHPLRLMMSVETDEQRIIALLHDVVEDTAVTFADLREAGYSESILAALDCLTHRKGEGYFQYIDRIKTNPLAVRVKRADLMDNMDLTRIPSPTPRDLARLEKYQMALEALD